MRASVKKRPQRRDGEPADRPGSNAVGIHPGGVRAREARVADESVGHGPLAILRGDRDVTSAESLTPLPRASDGPKAPYQGPSRSGRGARCVAAVPTIAGQRGCERHGGSAQGTPGGRFTRRMRVNGVSSRSWRVRTPDRSSSGVLDSPVYEVDDAIGSVCHSAVVADHDHCHPVPFTQRCQQVQGTRPAR